MSKPLEKEQLRELWSRLLAFIKNRGGFVTSIIDKSPLRFECPQGSTLPDALREKGFEARSCGTSERLMPKSEIVKQPGTTGTRTVQSMMPTVVSVYEIDLR